MKLEIEVRRERSSVTQGSARVYVNGELAITFTDDIELVKDGQPFYSEKITGWASVIPDEKYIKGLLYHPLDNLYHYSDRVKEILDEEIGRLEGMRWNIEVSSGIRERMKARDGFEPFVSLAVVRFMTRDYGEEAMDDDRYKKHPEDAAGRYDFQGKLKVCVVEKEGHPYVFLPEERSKAFPRKVREETEGSKIYMRLVMEDGSAEEVNVILEPDGRKRYVTTADARNDPAAIRRIIAAFEKLY